MKREHRKFALILLFVTISIVLILKYGAVMLTGEPNNMYWKSWENPIVPIKHTDHFMVSAFIDHRFNKTIRVIGIIRRDKLQPLYCSYYTDHDCTTVDAEVLIHRDHFGFPFGASDILCQGPRTENATHVVITATVPNITSGRCELHDGEQLHFLRIQNKVEQKTFKFNFTVCISNLFGSYNNVLQFAQSMEMYKLLGVDHVVIYNTSCGPDLEKLLQHYQQEGILEVVLWPIDRYLNPSAGWNSKKHEGELQYYGQMVTLNECIYRHMYQSRYVLLHDIDEIIMPYKHASLPLLMESLQQRDRNASIFHVENHIFPTTHFEESGKYKRPQWKDVPGVNIMEHIYREPDRKNVYNPRKMIVNPRSVVQTSVHSVAKDLGKVYNVPFDVCHIVHVRVPLQKNLTKQQLVLDSRVWDFEQELIPNVDRALQSSGLLKPVV